MKSVPLQLGHNVIDLADDRLKTGPKPLQAAVSFDL